MNFNYTGIAGIVLIVLLMAVTSFAQVGELSNDRAKADRSVAEVSQQNTDELLRLGVAANLRGDRSQALGHYRQALSVARTAGNRLLEARALENMGVLYAETSEREQAINYLHQALMIYRTIGNRVGEASTLSSIGYLYDNASTRAQALAFYQQALTIQSAKRVK
jgi:tetratricopeptide (TPR) repeat protein